MNLRTCIAIFFATVFFGKFLVMDTKILVSLSAAQEIVYFNPFCEKQKVKIQEYDSHESLAEDNRSFNLTIDSFCNAPFKFDVFTWESRIITEDTRTYADHNPSLPESAKDRFYPPPRA